MIIPLAQLITKRTKRRTFGFSTPDPLGRDRDKLLRIYLRVIRHWEGARIRLAAGYARELDRIAPISGIVGTTDSVADIDAEIEAESDWFDNIFLTLQLSIAEWTAELETWHRSKWRASILSASGVDLDTSLYASDVTRTVEASIRQNVELIKSVNAQQAERMTGAIFRGLNERKPARDLARDLAEITGFGRKRSILIASDQLQKIATALDTERMNDAGIKEFIWVHSGKKHPREWHKARNGNRYNLLTREASEGSGAIPADDMPGIPIRCGCKKRAYLVIEGVDDDGNPT